MAYDSHAVLFHAVLFWSSIAPLARLLMWMGADPAKSNTFGCHGEIIALTSAEEKHTHTQNKPWRKAMKISLVHSIIVHSKCLPKALSSAMICELRQSPLGLAKWLNRRDSHSEAEYRTSFEKSILFSCTCTMCFIETVSQSFSYALQVIEALQTREWELPGSLVQKNLTLSQSHSVAVLYIALHSTGWPQWPSWGRQMREIWPHVKPCQAWCCRSCVPLDQLHRVCQRLTTNSCNFGQRILFGKMWDLTSPRGVE